MEKDNKISRGNKLIQGLKTIPKQRLTTGDNLEKYNRTVEDISTKFFLDNQKSELSVYYAIKLKF